MRRQSQYNNITSPSLFLSIHPLMICFKLFYVSFFSFLSVTDKLFMLWPGKLKWAPLTCSSFLFNIVCAHWFKISCFVWFLQCKYWPYNCLWYVLSCTPHCNYYSPGPVLSPFCIFYFIILPLYDKGADCAVHSFPHFLIPIFLLSG